MTHQNHRLETVLREHNKNITAPRIAVYDELLDGKQVTIRQLSYRLKNTIDRASIYRTVQLFEKIGIVHRVYVGWKYSIELADDFQPHHHHLTCNNCGKIITIHDYPELEEAIASFASRESFMLTSHQVELQGICSDCNMRTKS